MNCIKNKLIQTQREFLVVNGINYRAEALIKKNKENPFFKEVIGEIYFVNQKYNEAIYFQTAAINNLNTENDIYLMMM